MRFHLTVLGSACSLLPLVSAQADADHALVVVQRSSVPSSALFDVDLTTGANVPLPGFPSDAFAPLALAIDPATREPTLALAATNGSRLVRVHLQGQQVLGETVLATMPGTVVGMLYPSVGDLFVAVDDVAFGGVHRVARSGGAPVLVYSAAGVSAISEPVILPGKYWTARDLSPAAPELAAFLDSTPGAPATGILLTWLPNARITGVHEFMAGTRWQMVADTLGRVHKMTVPALSTWSQLPLQPPIPAGGTRRLKGRSNGSVYVLGGSADPTLKSFPQTTAAVQIPVTVVAGPFPGDPVDFALVASDVARTVRFGAPCANPPGATAGAVATPELGSAVFAVTAQNALPSTYALFVAGWSERAFGGVSLPIPFGTCELLVSADTIAVQFSSPAGTATQPLPIPATTSLAGAIVYIQWWQDLTAPRSSGALSLQIY